MFFSWKYLHLLDPVCGECPKFYAVTSIPDRAPLKKKKQSEYKLFNKFHQTAG